MVYIINLFFYFQTRDNELVVFALGKMLFHLFINIYINTCIEQNILSLW